MDKKGDDSFFGYKDHVKCDSDSKIITNFSVVDASVHDNLEVQTAQKSKNNITKHYRQRTPLHLLLHVVALMNFIGVFAQFELWI
ncbi:MAG: hypothetical protein LBQ98_10690 [Nitrososphaerota archaeon]|jgi:hypothetical protein|nr:hypothetical protein [Nitrososphaerota archaeon]